MQPRLARSGTLTSPIDPASIIHSQVRVEWPSGDDPQGLSNNADECPDSDGGPHDIGSSKHRGSLKSLRPTKFSPPPRPPTVISNNVLLTILFIFVVILVIALIVTFTVFE